MSSESSRTNSIVIPEKKGSQVESANANAENVVTVFDLASEIEQLLSSVLKQVENQDRVLNERLDSILSRLDALEK